MAKQFICDDRTVVMTDKGKLRGFLFDGIYTFHGIRYAKAKRFHQPEEVKPWEGVKDALSYGMICPVLTQPKPTGEVLTPHRFWPESEHCQYLNVWTKSIDPSAKRPVIFWMHGGGFNAGSSIEQVAYEGDNLARFGDVVVVSVNHRLNVFGHLDLSPYGEQYRNSVNAGMADIVAAPKWVHDNIAAFGGDPENVTIFGQSGGGRKVTTLGQTPAAAGLFHKAMIMSGISDDPLMGSNISAEEYAKAVLDGFGLKPEEAEKLEKVPTVLFIRKINEINAKLAAEGKRYSYAPRPNDWYLGNPLEVGFAPHYQEVPLIVGTTFGEFNMLPVIPDADALSPAERRAKIAEHFGEENADEVVRLMKEAYPERNEMDAMYYDVMQYRPASLAYIKAKAALGKAPVWCYQFALGFNYLGGQRIAWHCSDIAFMFRTADRLPICQIEGTTEPLEEAMSGALLSLAYTGDPNGQVADVPAAGAGLASGFLPEWKPCVPGEMNVMIFDRTCLQKTNHEEELMPFLKAHKPPFRFDPSMFPKDEDEEEGAAWVF